MEIHELLRVLTRRWWIISATVLAGLLIAGVASAIAAPTYVATTRVYITTHSSGKIYGLLVSSFYAKHSVDTYADVARSSIVLQPVVDQLDLPYSATELADRVSVTVSALEPELLTITVTDTEGPRSAEIANAAAAQLGAVASRLSTGPTSVPVVGITQTQPAVAAARPEFPRTPIDLGVGLIAGLLSGLVLGTAAERLDSRIRRAEDVEDVAVLTGISRARAARTPLITSEAPSDERSEAFRRLSLAVQDLDAEAAPQVLVVSAASSSEFRASISADLALSMATTLSDKSGRVLLIAADMRERRLDDLLGIENDRGLSNVLTGRLAFVDAVHPWRGGGFDVLPAGVLPPNPLGLLQSRRLPALIDEARRSYDIVVVDAPPLLVSDAALLGSVADGTLLVVEAGRTTREQLRTSLEHIIEAGGHPVGAVLDLIAPPDAAHRGTHTVSARGARTATVGGAR